MDGIDNGQRQRCEACQDLKSVTELSTAPCHHDYCRECLTHFFEIAIRDESLFPPRCCQQEIPFEDNRSFLPDHVASQFPKKAVEYSTADRTYCHDPSCSSFIPPAKYELEEAVCGDCHKRTCIKCKGPVHDGGNGDCPSDNQRQQVLELARQEGWQRCQRCSAVVELDFGCNHITCPCGHEFCYECGQVWKTCNCEQWDEERLLLQAYRNYPIGVIQGGQPGLLPHQAEMLNGMEPRNRFRLRAPMQPVRNNPGCPHERWFNRRDPHTCNGCEDFMGLFIYECRQCHIMLCRRCRQDLV